MIEVPEQFSREQMLDLVLGQAPRSYIADHFGKYAQLPYIGRFLSRYELMKQIVGVHGSIIECGVGNGSGLIAWYQISKLLEPWNRHRIVYGFDTFEGFPSVSDKDGPAAHVGDQSHNICDDLERCVAMQCQSFTIMNHDGSNWLHPQKYMFAHNWQHIEIIKGDFIKTGETFIARKSHLCVSLLYLDFDLYEPTRRAIQLFTPRMARGSIICFDELNHPNWPGETRAVLETLGVRQLQLKRFPWEPTMSYAVMS